MYNRYSNYLKQKYGCSVYKLPINLPVSCPNRKGGTLPPFLCSIKPVNQPLLHGCTFCGEIGTGFEAMPNTASVTEQLAAGATKMREIYKAEKFIAYFQNFTNTFMPLNQFISYINEAASFPGVCEIAVSTRPDCIAKPYLDALSEAAHKYNISVSIELGLQTANYHTLSKVNRGHTLAEFIDATLQIKPYNFDICAHAILNLPWDTTFDAIETAKIISALQIKQVKLHALYILKDTPIAQQYLSGEFTLITADEYIERVIIFLEHLSPNIVVQRVIGRSPLNGSIFSNWGKSWWVIHDAIIAKMQKENRQQGQMYNYIGGAAVQKFIQ